MTTTNHGGYPRFHVVLRVDDQRLHRHQDEAAALREAERLARLQPGTTFFVLSALKTAEVPPAPVAIRETLTDDLPF